MERPALKWDLTAPEWHVLNYVGEGLAAESFRLAVKELVVRSVLPRSARTTSASAAEEMAVGVEAAATVVAGDDTSAEGQHDHPRQHAPHPDQLIPGHALAQAISPTRIGING